MEMTGKLRRIDDLDLSGRRVLARMDFNVPLSDGEIADDKRIRAGLPTLQMLVARGAAVVIASHLGRPNGKPDPALSLQPVAERLAELLGREVAFVPETTGPAAEQAAGDLEPGELLMLENTRFAPGEEENDQDYAAALSQLADVFVNDAFGSLHRAHASVVGVAGKLPAVAGLLVEKELAALRPAAENPARPYVAIIGGAKISDKLPAMEGLIERADTILVGGGIANTLLATQGRELGDSLVDHAYRDRAAQLLNKSWASIVLPMDLVVTHGDKEGQAIEIRSVSEINDGWRAMDIGPETIARFQRELANAATVAWAGPLGCFEIEPFSRGTFAIAETLSRSDAYVIAAGGETMSALRAEGVIEGFDHVSTGGGAALAFLSGETLPGLEVLRRS